jgi:hypothetical protein
VQKVPHLNTIFLPRVVLDVLLQSVELGVELVLTLTEDFRVLSEVKAVQFKKLGPINVSVEIQSRTRMTTDVRWTWRA